MCGWFNINFNDHQQLSWARTNSPSIDPGKDHTIGKNGHFLYVKRDLGINGDNTAKLISVQQKGKRY